MGQTPPMVIFKISYDVLESFLVGFLTEEITDRREEKSLVHNLESGGSDSPDGDVFKSNADPTLTFVLPTTLSAPAQTVRPHYHLLCLLSDKVFGRKSSFLAKAQTGGPHQPLFFFFNCFAPNSSSLPVGHLPKQFKSCSALQTISFFKSFSVHISDCLLGKPVPGKMDEFPEEEKTPNGL